MKNELKGRKDHYLQHLTEAEMRMIAERIMHRYVDTNPVVQELYEVLLK